MDYVLVFRPENRDELDEAYNWYEQQKVGLGDEFIFLPKEDHRQ